MNIHLTRGMESPHIKDPYIHLTRYHSGKTMRGTPTNPAWHDPTQYGRFTESYQLLTAES